MQRAACDASETLLLDNVTLRQRGQRACILPLVGQALLFPSHGYRDATEMSFDLHLVPFALSVLSCNGSCIYTCNSLHNDLFFLAQWSSLLSPILVRDVNGTLCLRISLHYCLSIDMFSCHHHHHPLLLPLHLRRSCHYAELCSCTSIHQTSGGGRAAAPQPTTLWSSSPSYQTKDKIAYRVRIDTGPLTR